MFFFCFPVDLSTSRRFYYLFFYYLFYYLYGVPITAENRAGGVPITAENSSWECTYNSVENSPESPAPVDKPHG